MNPDLSSSSDGNQILSINVWPVFHGPVTLWSGCGASSEFVSSSIPSWQILTAHAQPFRRAKDLDFFLKVPLDSLLVWASSGGSGETARMRRLAWIFALRIGDKYQIRLTRPRLTLCIYNMLLYCTNIWHCFGKNKKLKYQARQSRLGGTARQWLLYPTVYVCCSQSIRYTLMLLDSCLLHRMVNRNPAPTEGSAWPHPLKGVIKIQPPNIAMLCIK